MSVKTERRKKVLFLSPYPFGKAPSQRLKYEQYYAYFEEQGYDLTTSSFVDDEFWSFIYKPGNTLRKILFTLKGYLRRTADLFRLHKYDVVYTHLWVTPVGPPIFEWLVHKLSKKLVFDIDDMIFIVGKSAANPLRNLINGRKKSISLMKYADHVVTCTPDLTDFAMKRNAHCTDISSTVDTDINQPVNAYSNDKIVTIGWTGSHSTVKYLHLLTPVFQKLAQERKFKLRVIGTSDFHMEGVDYEYFQWAEDTEVANIQGMDIGVYPLPIDNWVLGKSGLKALQYMSFGLPTVATNYGTAINRIIVDGENGILVKTEDEWIEKLKYLIDNPDERRRIGMNGRQTVLEKFSVRATRDVYLNILNRLTEPSKS